MPFAIVATAGSASANSFVTAAEMTTYCEGRLNASTWTAAAAQWPALAEATRDLSVLPWMGSRTDSTQALAWPRTLVVDPDAPIAPGTTVAVDYPYYSDSEIPQRLKDATCELALQYLKAGTEDLAVVDPNAGVIEKTVDVLTTKWASAASRPVGWARFPRVVALIAPLLQGQGGGLDVVRV